MQVAITRAVHDSDSAEGLKRARTWHDEAVMLRFAPGYGRDDDKKCAGKIWIINRQNLDDQQAKSG